MSTKATRKIINKNNNCFVLDDGNHLIEIRDTFVHRSTGLYKLSSTSLSVVPLRRKFNIHKV